MTRVATEGAATGAGTGTNAARGKTRSSMGAGATGRRKLSYGSGPKTGDVLMSAKRRARQSEYARRRSRAIATEDEARPIAVD